VSFCVCYLMDRTVRAEKRNSIGFDNIINSSTWDGVIRG
jgi:hypothetical protein